MRLHSPLNLLLLLTMVPVVLLYLLKLRRQQFRVSSTLLWERLIKDLQANAPMQRLRANLLLLLQLLVLILGSIAFAAPFVKAQVRAGINTVVVLDASLSMQATDVSPSRFAEAQQQALSLVEGLRGHDQMMVIEAGARTRVMCSMTADKGVLRRAIEDCSAKDVPTNLREAIVLTLSLSQNVTQRTGLYIMSDGAFDEIPDVHLPEGVEFHFVKIGERGGNVAITGLDMRRALDDPSKVDLFIGVDNFGESEVPCPLTVERDGKLFRARKGEQFVIRPADRGEVVFQGLDIPSGVLKASIDVSDDLAADNAAYALVAPQREIRVLLLSDGKDAFIEKALNADPNVKLSRMRAADFQPGAGIEYDVIVCDGECPEGVGAGAYLFFSACPSDGPVTLVGEEERPRVLDWSQTHPITRYLSGLGRARIARCKTVEVKPWAKSIAETAETPIIVIGERQSFRSVYVGFAPADSYIVVEPTFPVFVLSALEWLAADPTQVEDQRYRTGQPVALTVPAGIEHIVVRTPKGESIDVPVKSAPVLFDRTEWAGLYEVSSDNYSRRFVVNVLDRAESNTKPKSEMRLTSSGAAVQASTVESNRELWRYFVVVALCVLSVEWWVYHRRI